MAMLGMSGIKIAVCLTWWKKQKNRFEMSNWKNFKLDEFKCKHCGENEIEYELIDKLQSLREDLGFPFIISSGYRCEASSDRKKEKETRHSQFRDCSRYSL